MSLALALKILTLAVLFVVSGGALFSDWGRRHMVLVGLASIVAILGTFYLIADIYEDLKRDSVETLREELLAQQRRSESRDEPETVERQPEQQPASCDGVEVDLASGGTKCIKRGSGEPFKDCADCPEMVVVPAGTFVMGSPDGTNPVRMLDGTTRPSAEAEEGRDDDEGPQHEVRIPEPFAVGKFEITRGQFAQFVTETGHDAGNSCWTLEEGEWKEREDKNWRDPGFDQSDSHPVVCVSWDDAQAYVKWLSEKTGKSYRLLSEAEWEYAARAGTTSRYWFGDDDSELGEHAWFNGNSGSKTHPVGEKALNPWGLHDVHGNVWEWVEDCWNASYANKPEDLKASGEAWTAEDCDRRVLRGGSWYGNPQDLRSANRYRYIRDNRFGADGFRLARTLTP